MARNTGQTAGIPKRGQLPTSDAIDTASANLECAAALIGALMQSGVRYAVISSGSRCAPLVIAASHTKGLSIWTNPDERSAGFFALGVAKATYHPALLICTSGTAAANYLPAVVEAEMSGVPMVVITADRPPRLRGVGAPQTIDQLELYGKHAARFTDLPVPDGSGATSRAWALAGVQAVQHSSAQPSPVHLNTPFDEPLIPEPDAARSCCQRAQASLRDLNISGPVDAGLPDAMGALDSLIAQIDSASRPLIVCGSLDEDYDLGQSIMALSRRIHAPVLADIASQLRRYEDTITHFDLFLREESVAARLTPDLILRFGGLPVSKSLNEWIAVTPAVAKVGVAKRAVADPFHCLTTALSIDPAIAVKELVAHVHPPPAAEASHQRLWRTVEEAAASVVERGLGDESETLESQIVASVCAHVGSGTNLFLSNSMPIRWADMYARARAEFPRVFVNRGANGIDGIVSAAAGIAAATARMTVCILGDIAFLHDQNGLWRLTATELPLKLVVLNNDGGGIFHFLPIAEHTRQFEPLVAMPHGVDLSMIAKAHGIAFHCVKSGQEFTSFLGECLKHPGPEIIEVRADRHCNFKRHRETFNRVSLAVRSAMGIE